MLGKNKVIQEVFSLWAASANREDFEDEMTSRGWKSPPVSQMGGFKTALWKGKLVAKFSDDPTCNHTEHEWKLYKRASSYKRRFLARCYAFKDGLLIQERVNRCFEFDDCKEAAKRGRLLRILDWAHNHGHRSDGRPVFFDYDASGSGWWTWKRRRNLTRRA